MWGMMACPGRIDDRAPFFAARTGQPPVKTDGATINTEPTTPTDGGQVTPPADRSATTPLSPGCEPATIFQQSCSGSACHDAGNVSSNIDLFSAGIPERLRTTTPTMCASGKFIVPGSPESGFFWEKITSDASCGGKGGSKMPLVKAPLTTDELNCIKEWLTKVVDAN